VEILLITILLIIPAFFVFLWILFSIIGKIRPFPYFMGKYLDSNYRRIIQPPDKLMKRSGIKEGMQTLENSMNFRCSQIGNLRLQKTKFFECPKNQSFLRILEVGCGSGAFTNYIARAVGDKGKVYAVDIQPEMLEQLKKKLKHFENIDINNVTLVECDACKMPFEDNYFDLVLSVAALQEIPNRQKALQEIKRVLKPHGVLAITEFILDPDYPLKSTTIRQCENAGFLFDDFEGSFLNYTARFIKPDFDFEKLN